MDVSELICDLKNYFRSTLPDGNNFSVQAFKVLKSGWAGDIYSFNLVNYDRNIDEQLVLKIYNSSKDGVYSIEKEGRALETLNKLEFPVPKIFKYDTSLNYFGRPFIIMEEVKGSLLWEEYIKADENKKKILLEYFTRLLFKLHSIEIANIDPDYDFESKQLSIDNELNEIEEIIYGQKLLELNEVYQWLIDNKKHINNLKPAILHRDYHPWNVIVTPSGSCRVIDWVWGIGDYRFDLAWTVTLMERSGFSQFAVEVFESYSKLCKYKIDNFEYFKVLATLRWLLNVTSSIKTGENLREGTAEEFKDFLEMPIKNALQMIKNITNIDVEI